MIFRVLILLVAALGLVPATRLPAQVTYQGVGTEAPEALLSDLDGTKHRLSEGSGSWMLFKFGTTWCPGCGQEVQELNKLAADLQALGVRVVEIFLKETPAAVRADLKSQPRAFRSTWLVDERGETISTYDINVIPRLLLVDPQGVVRIDTHFTGAAKLKQTLQKAIQRR